MAKLRHVLPLAHLLGGTRLEGQGAARIEGGAKVWSYAVAAMSPSPLLTVKGAAALGGEDTAATGGEDDESSRIGVSKAIPDGGAAFSREALSAGYWPNLNFV